MERPSANVAYIYSDLNATSAGVSSGPAGSASVLSSMAASGGLGAPGSGVVCSSSVVMPPPHISTLNSGLGPTNSLPGSAPPPHIPADENYCLKWNEYEKKYAETFRDFRDDEFFADVTLATEGHSVKAHRVILSACSNYFHAILKTMSPWQHPVLLLHDVESADLNSLMDFIYFGQASVSQDSIQKFLDVAKKFKIKGLCEAAPPLIPPPIAVPVSSAPPSNTHHSVMRKELVMNQNSSVLHSVTSAGPLPQPASVSNFEGLLPRSPYPPEPSVVPLSQTSNLPPPSGTRTVSSAPPLAHQQNSRQSVRAAVPPPPPPTRPSTETLMHYATPKRAKYASVSPQSILRSQLQLKDSTEHVEVKSEPMAILSTQEDVPSSGVNVTEFISAHENDLTLQSLGPGISPQFMFSPDPSDGAGQPGGSGGPPPPVATMVTIDEKTIAATSNISSLAPGTVIQTSNSHHMHVAHIQHGHQHGAGQSHSKHGETHRHDEPQDLTPGPQDSPSLTHTPPNSNNNGTSSLQSTPSATPTSASASFVGNSSSTPTPPKKDRNSRKTCTYCHKDFHEMSLKRHIKDVHFRSQNTYVICPQCCKQYASQNSLYSHLNRVHGVKKEMLTSDMQMHMVQQQTTQQQQQQPPPQQHSGASASNNATGNSTTPNPGSVGDNHQECIMDLAHHSDSSN